MKDWFNLEEDLSKKRLKICYACPLYSKKHGGLCNNNLWLDVNSGDVSTTEKQGYQRGCGCKLSFKTKVPTAKCPVNKW